MVQTYCVVRADHCLTNPCNWDGQNKPEHAAVGDWQDGVVAVPDRGGVGCHNCEAQWSASQQRSRCGMGRAGRRGGGVPTWEALTAEPCVSPRYRRTGGDTRILQTSPHESVHPTMARILSPSWLPPSYHPLTHHWSHNALPFPPLLSHALAWTLNMGKGFYITKFLNILETIRGYVYICFIVIYRTVFL